MKSNKIFVPPIKIQGIKTKLVPWILENTSSDFDASKGKWIEPFLGSGVVGFNFNAKNALFADTNPYIINFYNHVKQGKITSGIAKSFLEYEGKILSQKGDKHYYYLRERFNESRNPLDFLFLNRSCFNGMIRFNSSLKFNVPYGHKLNRFTQSYVTKITNQIKFVETRMKVCNWEFKCQSFEKTLATATKNDFVYCDPPYIGRHVDYYDSWDADNEFALHKLLMDLKANFILSTWDRNKYRTNQYLEILWNDCHKINKTHFYHIGGKETNRNEMMEALVMNYIPKKSIKLVEYKNEEIQLKLAMDKKAIYKKKKQLVKRQKK